MEIRRFQSRVVLLCDVIRDKIKVQLAGFRVFATEQPSLHRQMVFMPLALTAGPKFPLEIVYLESSLTSIPAPQGAVSAGGADSQ